MITAVITYCLRCNIDVTSLKSGTAIGATIHYVSEYIVKPSLKTYVIFDAIRSVFLRSVELLNSTDTSEQKSRKLITRIVNNLGIKMELGNPMMCSYLLGFPDHYTNAKFVIFFWKHYVSEVLFFWNPDDPHIVREKVMIKKYKDEIIKYSRLDDYMFRPLTLKHLCVWDWIRLCKNTTHISYQNNISPSSPTKTLVNDHDDDGEQNYNGYESDNTILSGQTAVEVNDFPIHINFENTEEEDSDVGKHYFADGHGLKNTHYVICCSEDQSLIPNITGGALPRKDQENRDYYCCTMLSIFKPWTSPSDLKTVEQTWSQAFNAHIFTDRQKQLMANFHLRYECLDARDNFRDQMKLGLNVDQGLQELDNHLKSYETFDEEFSLEHNDYNLTEL
ncbi:hypothetical protein BDZ89DRAFT_963123, partial [Hymenopellis radicata]